MKATQLESQLFCRGISENLVDLAGRTSVKMANYLPKAKISLDQGKAACSLFWCFLSRYGAFRTLEGVMNQGTQLTLKTSFFCDAHVKK